MAYFAVDFVRYVGIVANLKRVAGQRKILISLTIVAQPEII